jgi:hypothetical protein
MQPQQSFVAALRFCIAAEKNGRKGRTVPLTMVYPAWIVHQSFGQF